MGDYLGRPEALTILTAVLVLITGIYAFLTWLLVRANSLTVAHLERQFESQTRPIIAVNIGVRESVVLFIAIRNRGASAAYDVALSIDKDFFQFAELDAKHNLRNFQAFQDRIPTMSPDDGLQFDLSQGFNLGKEVDGSTVTPLSFKISATYRSSTRTYTETFPVDLRPFMHTHTPRTIAEQLGRIEQHLKKIAEGAGR